MEDSGKEQTIQPEDSADRKSVGDAQPLEVGTLLGSGMSEVPAAMAVQEPSVPTQDNPIQQLGTAVVERNGGVGTTTTTSSSGSGSGFDADVDETDHTVSAASSSDLLEAYDMAMEALQLGNHRERNTFIWIDKCLESVGRASSDLRNLATNVLRTTGIADIDVQSTISKGGTAPPRDDTYKQRFLAVHEYLLAAYRDIAVQENAKMAEKMGKVVMNLRYPDTEASSSEYKNYTIEELEEMAEELGLPEFMRNAFRRGKMDYWKTTAGDDLNPEAAQEEVTPEVGTSSGGENEKESLTVEGSAEKHDKTTESSKDNESDPVGGHQELTASTGSNSSGSSIISTSSVGGQEEMSEEQFRKNLAVVKVCRRAEVIRKLVKRQWAALSRMTATAQTRAYRLSSVCQFVLTCVNCATCVCKSALNAHGLAQLALQIAETADMPDLVACVAEAVIAASQYLDMAVANCETAVQLHRDAVSILEDFKEPLAAAQNDDLLGEHTVRETIKHADAICYTDGQDVCADQLADKLSLMESAIGTLSHAVQRCKGVNQITKKLARKFDDAAFQISVVGTVFGASQYTVRVMAATSNALGPLYRLRTGAQTEGLPGRENRSENVPSVGRGNLPREEEPVHEANDL